jgi:hypothetical protein
MNNKGLKVILQRGSRYYDVHFVIHTIVYSKDVIKLMPIKPDSVIEVWDKNEFIQQVKLFKFIFIPHPKINRINVSEHLLEFQFNILGKTMFNTTQELDWKEKWKLTQNQKNLFKSYAHLILKKVFKCNSSKASETYEFFDSNFGLSVI